MHEVDVQLLLELWREDLKRTNYCDLREVETIENHHRPWSDEDLGRLVEYRVKRMPIRQIATVLGRTPRSVWGKWGDYCRAKQV